MKSLSLLFAFAALLAAPAGSIRAADAEPAALSASSLAAQMSQKQAGTSLVRVKMVNSGAADSTLQLQIKSRVSRGGSEVLYQVLWPKERKGEAVLLRRAGRSMSGTALTLPDKTSPIAAGQMDEPLLGSALSYEDAVDDFFAWGNQALVGTETVDKVECQVLESKPSGSSSYSSVKSWIDTKRMVPMRVEKYAGGKVLRQIETTQVAKDHRNQFVPANLSIRGPRGASTVMDGSRIRQGMDFNEATFSPEGMKDIGTPKGAE